MASYRVPELAGFQWQQPVTGRVTAPTGSEVKGTRYIVIATATGVFTGHEKSIATAKITNPILATDWYFDVPSEGCICWVDDENGYYVYDGSTWSGYFNQSLLTTSSPTFANLTLTNHLKIDDTLYNLQIGYQTGNAITTGNQNILIGYLAGTLVDTGSQNVAIGYLALSKATSGGKNVAIGYQALKVVTTVVSGYNVAIGWDAAYQLTTGSSNVAIGTLTLSNCLTGTYNLAIGMQALQNCTGDYNTGMGGLAGQAISSGTNNLCVGFSAGYSLDTTSDNVCIGANSGFLNVGYNNVYIGSGVGHNNSAGYGNTYIGYVAGEDATGYGGISIGQYAGYFETGNNKLFIDSIYRSSETFGRTESLIYGIFAAAPANQSLTINGNVLISQIKAGATQVACSAAANELWKTSGHASLPDNVVMIGV